MYVASLRVARDLVPELASSPSEFGNAALIIGKRCCHANIHQLVPEADEEREQ